MGLRSFGNAADQRNAEVAVLIDPECLLGEIILKLVDHERNLIAGPKQIAGGRRCRAL